MRYFLILIIALFFLNCNGSHSFSIYHKDIQLPSGQHFKVFNFERRYLEDTPTLIILEYETDLSLDDTTQLKIQVADIWKVFKSEAEEEPFPKAFIIPKKSLSGLGVEASKWHTYQFDKLDDGTWSTL